MRLNSDSVIASRNPARWLQTISPPENVVLNIMPQDLLRQCIRVEVGERLSLEAILGHPWLLPNVNSSLDPTTIGPTTSGLGGLPIPSREHGAKGISHPQVKMVTDACIHPALHSSRIFKFIGDISSKLTFAASGQRGQLSGSLPAAGEASQQGGEQGAAGCLGKLLDSWSLHWRAEVTRVSSFFVLALLVLVPTKGGLACRGSRGKLQGQGDFYAHSPS